MAKIIKHTPAQDIKETDAGKLKSLKNEINSSATQAILPNHLENPRNKYLLPPYQHQDQPRPALASKMNPKPEHG